MTDSPNGFEQLFDAQHQANLQLADRRIDAALAGAPLDPAHEAAFRAHLRAVDARETCLICDAGRFTAHLAPPWIARICAQCGFVALFSPVALELQPGWRLHDGRWIRALVPAESPAGEPTMTVELKIDGGRPLQSLAARP